MLPILVSLDTVLLLAAHFALLVTYLLVGHVFWRKFVFPTLLADANSRVMVEQDRSGHLAMLLPKFTVIALWPLAFSLAVICLIATMFRQPATYP